MLIYENGNIRVIQHPYLQLFNVEVFRKGDWIVEKQVSNIQSVNELVSKLTLSLIGDKQEIV